VQISGHTDRKGTEEDNDALSQKRAESILAQLIQDGIPKEQMTAVGRGERDPRVPTDDGVDEIANRRVEVVVR
jgi:outer membrane protein OmpA-like peptidoglycan-associated protein